MTSVIGAKIYVDSDGRCIGNYHCTHHEHDANYDADGLQISEAWVEEIWPDPPEGGVEVPEPPGDARQVWDGAQWVWPPEALLDHLADLRWRRETAGIVVEGMPMATDRDAQAMITGAALAAQLEGPGYELRWKTRDGFVALTGAQVIALAQAVRAHVQACFDAEADIAGRVQNGEITTLAGLEAAVAEALPLSA